MHVSESFLQLVRRVLVGFALVLLAFVVSDTLSPRQSVSAQNAGVVGIATISQPAFTSQASSASSGIFKDIGQAANNLYFCTTGFTGTINLEWSPTGSAGPFKPIVLGTYTTDTGCHSLTAAGYYPNLRSTMTRTLGSLSAWYNASAGPIGFTPRLLPVMDRVRRFPAIKILRPASPAVRAGARPGLDPTSRDKLWWFAA